MSTFTVITSFSDKLWQAYARKSFASVYDNLPEHVDVIVYYNGAFEQAWADRMPRAEFIDMNKEADYQYYRQKYKTRVAPEGVPPGHMFRFNHLPFWNKVFAINDAAWTADEKYLIWIDADVISQAPITMEDLERWVEPNGVSTLVRSAPWNTWETGFLALDTTNRDTLLFVKDVYDAYLSGTIFDFNEWHDAYLFTVMYKKYRTKLPLKNLNMQLSSAHPFDTSILPPQLFHMKGQRKIEGRLFDQKDMNGVFRADFVGPINVKDEGIYKLTDSGNIVYPDGQIKCAI